MRGPTVLVAVLLGILVAACGGDQGATSTTQPSTTTGGDATTVTSTTVLETTSTTEAPPTTEPPSTSTTQAVTTTTGRNSTSTTLAGEPIDFGPRQGDVLMVVGVGYNDILNLRASPGVGSTIVAEIPPTFLDLTALGNTRQLPGAFWVEVDYVDTPGWVHMSFIGYEGMVDDMTSFVVNELGATPEASTMTELGESISAVLASEDPASDIVQVTPVTSGDLHEVTYDVIGLGDDAVRGVRIHVFAEKAGADFRMKSVEVTTICGRGVDSDGLCT